MARTKKLIFCFGFTGMFLGALVGGAYCSTFDPDPAPMMSQEFLIVMAAVSYGLIGFLAAGFVGAAIAIVMDENDKPRNPN